MICLMRTQYQREYVAFIFVKGALLLPMLLFRASSAVIGSLFGFSILLCSLIQIVWLGKRSMLMSCLTPSAFFSLCFGLYLISLDKTISSMSDTSILWMYISIAVWELITCWRLDVSSGVIDANKLQCNISPKVYKTVIVVLFLMSASTMVLEWIVAGGIPVLREDAETFRFTVSFNTYVHILAISVKFVPMLCVIAYLYFGRLWIKNNKSMVAIALMSIVLLIGTAQRGELLCSVALALFALMIFKPIPKRYIVLSAIIGGFILGFYPIIRNYAMYGDYYIHNMMAISKYPGVWFLTPLYETLAYNLHILNRLLDIFPVIRDYGYGAYTILQYIPFLDLGQSLSQVQNDVWNLDFYGALVSTAFGPWYADYGYIGWVFLSIFLGVLSTAAQNSMTRRRTPAAVAFYSYVLYNCFMVSYANTFDQIFVFYSILLFLISWISKSSNRTTGYCSA